MKYKTKWVDIDLSKNSLSSLLDKVPNLVVLDVSKPEDEHRQYLRGELCQWLVIGSGSLDARPLLKVHSAKSLVNPDKEEVINCYLAVT